MRYVEITIPTGKRRAILDVLKDEGLDYVVAEETGNEAYTAVVSFPIPTDGVEPVLDRLRGLGLEDDAYTVVLNAETIVSRKFEALEQRYERPGDGVPESRRPRGEIRTRARALAPDRNEFLVMTVLSIAIATAGVLLDSVAVVVGSMVIAPLIGPAMATSVGTVLRDRELFVRGVKLQVLGGVLGVTTAAALAFAVKTIHIVPPGLDVTGLGQVESRLTPGLLSLMVALGSGIAGAYSLSSGLSSALVGVAIAVALVPPTAVIGIGIAYALPVVVIGSTLLVLVNFFSINLGALALLWFQGYRPAQILEHDAARADTVKRAAALAAVILLLSAFLGGVTYYSYRAATIEQDVRSDVETVLDRPEYGELNLIDVTVEYEDPVLRRNPDRVVVTIGRPPGTEHPSLPGALAEAIDRPLVVEVRFVPIERPAG